MIGTFIHQCAYQCASHTRVCTSHTRVCIAYASVHICNKEPNTAVQTIPKSSARKLVYSKTYHKRVRELLADNKPDIAKRLAALDAQKAAIIAEAAAGADGEDVF